MGSDRGIIAKLENRFAGAGEAELLASEAFDEGWVIANRMDARFDIPCKGPLAVDLLLKFQYVPLTDSLLVNERNPSDDANP